MSISNLPSMLRGSDPTDGGSLIFSKEEYQKIINRYPYSKKFFKYYVGAGDFMQNTKRHCLWIKNHQEYLEASQISMLHDRLTDCENYRKKNSRDSVTKLANRPYFFGGRRYKNQDSILVPRVGSENREYLPIGIYDFETVIADSAIAIYYNPNEFWIFGILSSKMHLAWVKAVAGRLKMDIRYSNTLCYNTFPMPEITEKMKKAIETSSRNILKAREADKNFSKTNRELYDPKKMPNNLRQAHQKNDILVDKCFKKGGLFQHDSERLKLLFKLYSELKVLSKTTSL